MPSGTPIAGDMPRRVLMIAPIAAKNPMLLAIDKSISATISGSDTASASRPSTRHVLKIGAREKERIEHAKQNDERGEPQPHHVLKQPLHAVFCRPPGC